MTPSPEVVAAAQAAQKAWRVPASVSIAQWALESGWGKHCPAGSFNYFGIKAFHGGGVESATTEVVNGVVEHVQQPFAVFASMADAFDAHAKLLATDQRYAPAMAALPDLERFVVLMAHIYATDPAYDLKIMEIINGDNLTQYDLGADA